MNTANQYFFMSLNDITNSFGQYVKDNPKQCKHFKEMLNQAIMQLEEEIQIIVHKRKINNV